MTTRSLFIISCFWLFGYAKASEFLEEEIDPNESAEFAGIAADLKLAQLKLNPTKRGLHNKVHGCISGEMNVLTNIPEWTQQGIFKPSNKFPAVVRYTNSARIEGPDDEAQLHGMAIKLFNVPGEKLLPSVSNLTNLDFILNDGPTPITSNPREFGDLILALSKGSILSYLLFNPSFAYRIIKLNKKIDHTLSETYWSGSAYLLGNTAMKFNVMPCEQVKLNADLKNILGKAEDRDEQTVKNNFLKYRLHDYISTKPLCLSFNLQKYIDNKVTPIEEATEPWLENNSPSVKVAELNFLPQDSLDTEVFNKCELLNFNPWKTIEQHRPLGKINRARRGIYAGSQKTKLLEDEVLYEPTTPPNIAPDP